MKTLLCLLFTIGISNLFFAQTDKYILAMDAFQTNYNAEKYDEIFNGFSPELKKALPIEDTKQFFANLNNQVGKIENMEFISYQQGGYATYKTTFKDVVLGINISLDNEDQINGLFATPYGELNKTEHSTVKKLDNYPKEIAEIIFSKSKDFPNNTQLSIALIENGKTSYYGIIKTNDTIKAIENQSNVFEIGSITKVFTSTVLASLVEDGKIKLDDEINSYYEFPFKDNIKLTFVNLANHTSGLPRLPGNLDFADENNPYKNYGKSQIENYLKNILTLKSNLSESYSYSNLGTGLLGYTLGLVQKTTFEELLKKNVFEKYNMKSSFTSIENLNDKLVKGQNKYGKISPNWDFNILFGAGGILSTTEDLAKFATAQFNPGNKELALTRNPTFDINDHLKIGLGWHLLKSSNGEDLGWHNGGTGGYSSSMIANLSAHTAVIILSNVSAAHPRMGAIDELCFELINRL